MAPYSSQQSKRDGAIHFAKVFRVSSGPSAIPVCRGAKLDYMLTTLLTTYRIYARTIRSLAHRGRVLETILKAEAWRPATGGS